MGNLAYFKLYMEKAVDGNWQVKVKVGANKRNISNKVIFLYDVDI